MADQLAHLFFSYAHADADRMYPIHRRMEALLGRKLWIDRIGLRRGIKWENAIKRGINQSYGIIFAVTKTFIDRKFILKKEIPWSIDHFKKEQGPLLFVIRFDDVALPPALATLPDYQCQVIDAIGIDFSLVATDKAAEAQARESRNQQALIGLCGKLNPILPAPHEGDQPFIVSWPRLENFKGRDNTLVELHQLMLGEGKVGVNSHISVGLHGMGGIGKTQLAVEYAYHYRFYYPAGVFWINAAADWSQQLVALADRLGRKPADATDPDRAKQQINALEHYLRDRASNEDGDALIVMDNVENPADVTTRKLANGATMLGTDGSFCTRASARLLVTTRLRDLPTQLKRIEVKVLDPLDARSVLLDARPTETNLTDVDELCKTVGYLPLPLGWFAAALRKDPNLSPMRLKQELVKRDLDNVIQVFRKKKIDLGTPTDYEAITSVAFNWQIALAIQLCADSRLLLELAASFAEAAQLPLSRLRLLSGLSDEDDFDLSPFQTAINALMDVSLVERLNETQIRLHPLVRQFVQSKFDPSASQTILAEGADRLVAAYRTPSILAIEAELRGVPLLINDLRITHDTLSPPPTVLTTLLRLFTLEQHKLDALPPDVNPVFVVQQVRDRAYHETADSLVAACDEWLLARLHLAHIGSIRYPQSQSLLRVMKHHAPVNGVLTLRDGRLLSWAADTTLQLWSGQGEPLIRLDGHTSYVNGVRELRDRRLLSWAADKTLRLWSEQGEPLTRLDGHSSSVHGALELRNGRLLSWAADKTLRLWSEQGEPLICLDEHTAPVYGALELRNGHLLSWSEDKTLWLWSEQGEPLIRLDEHTAPVYGALELRDGHLLSWSEDKTLWLWSEQGEPLICLDEHTAPVYGALELRNGHLLSWSEDKTLWLWSEQGEPLIRLDEHTAPVYGALELRDGRLLSWSEDKTLWLWSEQGEPLARLDGHLSSTYGALELHDRRLLSWSRDTTLRLWSGQGEPLARLYGHFSGVSGALELHDGHLLSWSLDMTLRLWSEQGEPLIRLYGHSSSVHGALELHDGRLLSWSKDTTLWLWSEQGEPLTRLDGHLSFVHGALELRDGRLLSWSEDKTLRLWSGQGEPLTRLEGHTSWVYGALELRDGRLLSWSQDDALRLWSEQGEPLIRLDGHSARVYNALELHDRRLLSWSQDNTLRLWNEQGKPLARLDGHTAPVNNALELHDRRLLSWSQDNTLRLWSEQGEPLTRLDGHTAPVYGALGLRDGRLLSWSEDKTLRLWNGQGKPLIRLEGHMGSVYGALELRDGCLLSWSQDNTLWLWSGQGKPLIRLDGHTALVYGALELRDGRLLSWSQDNTLRLWNSGGAPLLVYHADAPITCCFVHFSGLIIAGDNQGHLLFLRLSGT